MKRAVLLTLVASASLAYVSPAEAGPHNVLVLRSEGNAAEAARSSVDSHVLRLARHIEGKVDAGDITLADAAAAAGCDASAPSCKDEILMTFAVDELVATTVTTGAGGQLNVTVKRLAKGSAPRQAVSTIVVGRPPEAKLNADIGPLFGAGFATAPLAETPDKAAADKAAADKTAVKTAAKADKADKAAAKTDKAATKTDKAAAKTDKTATKVSARDAAPVTETPPASDTSSLAPVDPYASTSPEPSPAAPPIAAAPPMPEGQLPSRRAQKIGIGVGAGLVVLSVVLWSSAASLQDDIDSAPVSSPADFAALRELERKADDRAGAGNLFFIAGVAVAGVSGYYYWKKGRDTRTQTARVTPVVFPGGGGVVLSFGGGL